MMSNKLDEPKIHTQGKHNSKAEAEVFPPKNPVVGDGKQG